MVGSLALEFYGLRKAHDIDFILSSEYADAFPGNAVKVTKNCEKVGRGWLRHGKDIVFPDDEIIGNPALHFCYDGVKVARLPLVVYKKAVTRREKDVVDLGLVAERIEKDAI